MLSSDEWIYESPWFFENWIFVMYLHDSNRKWNWSNWLPKGSYVNHLIYNLLISSLFWHNDDELDRFINVTDKINTQNNVTF